MRFCYDRGPLPYTDLATERRRANTEICGVEYTKQDFAEGTLERVRITTEAGAKSIGRPMGIYETVSFTRADLIDTEGIEWASRMVSDILRRLTGGDMPKSVLAAGIGNRALTADSLGCLVCERVKPTRHLKLYDERLFSSLGCSEISVITPGVTAKTGLDCVDTVKAVCESLKPELVIAVDAIATSSYERLGSTVQITDTGICPGSGLFNVERALNGDTLGTRVFSLGVPTIIDARVLYLDGLGDRDIPNIESIPSHSMFVSPKEIDEIVNVSSQIIANGINMAFGIY